MSNARPIYVSGCKYDVENNAIVMSVLFLDTKMHRRFCWPADDLINAFNIAGKVESHHWEKFCKDIIGKTIKMVCEMIGDVEAPAATMSQMESIINNSSDKYFA